MKAMNYSFLKLITLLLVINSYTAGQHNQPNDINNLGIEVFEPGVVKYSIVKEDSVLQSVVLDLNEEVRAIIQLREAPLSATKSSQDKHRLNISGVAAKIVNEHQSFKSSLSDIEKVQGNNKFSNFKKTDINIRYEYTIAINGFAITTRRWVLEEIKKIANVKAVYEDNKFKITDDISNNKIGADTVWAKFGLTGKGIKIGILDTGIDYMHPDLGAGIGDSFKVFGGYDFINNDNNPADDHGHGTHVAGIAAANGEGLKGVAPDAKLFALKVLNRYGEGFASSIIAGIEKAMDPDNNPSTDDHLDIINMSFGGEEDPENPISQAVDNASAYGIVCVAAAGNDASYNSIVSPGCSRSALTVGASDNSDNIAWFSSRGPAKYLYSIKPDVVAPGVAIKSAQNGGGYVSMDGTSMAAPHVAGCAALILEQHPNWRPEIIKSVLMQSAKDLGKDIFTQGCGRIDAYQAILKNTIIAPASISLGLSDLSKQNYSITDTLTVHNFSATEKSYVFSLAPGLHSGITVDITPSLVSVQPSESKDVIVTSVINNGILPFPTSNPPSFSGRINAISHQDTIEIPIALVKSAELQFNFDEAPWVVYVHGDNGYYTSLVNKGTAFTKLLPQGIYSVHVIYFDIKTHIIKDGIEVNSVSSISINKSEAKNSISLLYLDETGEQINAPVGIEIFHHKPTEFETYLSGAFSAQKYFSDFGTDYLWEWQACTYAPSKFYSFNGFLSSGCTSDVTQQNDPALFKHINYFYNIDPGITQIYPIYVFGHLPLQDTYSPLTSPFQQQVYLTPIPYRGFAESHITGSPYFFQMIFKYEGAPFNIYNAPLLLQTPMLYIASKDVAEIRDFSDRQQPLEIFTDTDLYCGNSAPHWFGRMNNNSTSVKINGGLTNNFNSSDPFVTNYFYFPMKDWVRIPDLKYTLYQDNDVLREGILNSEFGFSTDVNPNKYLLETNSSHFYIAGTKASAKVKLSFDTRKPDKNPPSIGSFKIIKDGIIIDQINHAQSGEIKFDLSDDYGIKSVNLKYCSEADTLWRELSLLQSAFSYSAIIPQKMPDENISLRLLATDNSGNILDYVIEPAFKVNGNNHSPEVNNITNLTAFRDSLFSARIIATDLEGDSLTYSLIDKYPSWLTIDSVSGYLSGIPGARNVWDNIIFVRVTDSEGGSVSKQFNIYVNFENHLPVITSIADTLAREDSLFISRLEAADTDGDSITFSLIDEPGWLKIDSVSGVLSGTPRANNLGLNPVSVKVEDWYGGFTIRTFNINVIHTNHFPSAVKLKLPKDTDTLVLKSPSEPVVFSWNAAKDIDTGDTLTYIFHLNGALVDTIIAVVEDTTFDFNNMNDMVINSIYKWTVSVTDGFEVIASEDTFNFKTSDAIVSSDYKSFPQQFSLSQNYPNPFNPATLISFEIPVSNFVKLKVYDILGKEIITLVNEVKPAGKYEVEFDGNELASGIYIYQLKAGNFLSTKRMILIK